MCYYFWPDNKTISYSKLGLWGLRRSQQDEHQTQGDTTQTERGMSCYTKGCSKDRKEVTVDGGTENRESPRCQTEIGLLSCVLTVTWTWSFSSRSHEGNLHFRLPSLTSDTNLKWKGIKTKNPLRHSCLMIRSLDWMPPMKSNQNVWIKQFLSRRRDVPSVSWTDSHCMSCVFFGCVRCWSRQKWTQFSPLLSPVWPFAASLQVQLCVHFVWHC